MDFTPIFSDYDNSPVPDINILKNISRFLDRIDTNHESFNKAKESSLKILKMHLSDLDIAINDMGDMAATSALTPFFNETKNLINEIEDLKSPNDINNIVQARALFILIGERTRYLKLKSPDNLQKIESFLKLNNVIFP